MKTTTAMLFLGALTLTADLDTAIRFAMRTGATCTSPDQTHVVDGRPVSPLAVIVQGTVEAEKEASAWQDGMDALVIAEAMAAIDEAMPATERDVRAA